MKKVILITGSNRGIGFEIASQLGAKGHQIILSGRQEHLIKEATDKLRDLGIPVQPLQMDVSDPESIRKAAKWISEYQLRIDVLINNAAILLPDDRKLVSNSIEILEKTVQTNCFGTLNIIHTFLPFMNRPGRIIQISSRGGSMSDPVGGWSPAYCVSKSMLNAITRHLAYELASERIAVNAVCPGWVKTRMGGRSAPRPVEKGSETPVWLADEAPQSLTGKFFRDKKQINW